MLGLCVGGLFGGFACVFRVDAATVIMGACCVVFLTRLDLYVYYCFLGFCCF